ncbi:MAG: FtsW/RodA/SpoVE family cell cycle protein [Lachnospiraceae bacterium]|nr:FtsW/RodA/SpoVE family cell cycle protein [Lachnospiraceae bacterium]
MLLLAVLVLCGFGLLVLYSSSAYNGQVRFGDSAYYFKKQLLAMTLGLAAMAGMSQVDYHVLGRFSGVGYLLSLALSGAVLLFGDAYNGSRRWLSIGPLSFQPSEYAKPAVILLLAGIISRASRRRRSPEHQERRYASYRAVKGNSDTGRRSVLSAGHPLTGAAGRSSGVAMIALVFLAVLPIVALVGTNNLSTAVIILGIAVIMIFVSSPRYLPFLGIIAAGVGFLAVFLSLESYRLERLAIWRNPELYEKGYQTMQGLYAIGSGGLFGLGFGKGLQKLGFVPEAQNDMIFSVICEEMGLVGAVLLIFLFLLLPWRFMVIATHAPDLFGSLIAAGIMGHIAIQVILNIAVVTNTIPNTGITLPFISYGGTSMCFLLAEMGMALSVSRFCRYPGKRRVQHKQE